MIRGKRMSQRVRPHYLATSFSPVRLQNNVSPSASDTAIVAANTLFSLAVKVALLVNAGIAESAMLVTVIKIVLALVLVPSIAKRSLFFSKGLD